LVAQGGGEPIKQRGWVTAPNRTENSLSPQFCTNLIDQIWRTSQAADSVDDADRVIERPLGYLASLPSIGAG